MSSTPSTPSTPLGPSTRSDPLFDTAHLTPWGLAEHISELAPHIVSVTTASHGGIGVHSKRPLPARFAGYGTYIAGSAWRWFEQDCQWAIVAMAFPEVFEETVRTNARQSVRYWYPTLYENLTGVRQPPAATHAARQREMQGVLFNRFKVVQTFQDWAWDVPTGYVYVQGQRASDGATRHVLVPREAFDQARTANQPLILEHYPEWHHDERAPRVKPRSQRGGDQAMAPSPTPPAQLALAGASLHKRAARAAQDAAMVAGGLWANARPNNPPAANPALG